jgi:hypothetical protein
MQWKALFRKKNVNDILNQVNSNENDGHESLGKHLGVRDLAAFGIAAIIGGKIVWQANSHAPLLNFDLLGYVVVGVILINIYLTRRVYLYVARKNKEAA